MEKDPTLPLQDIIESCELIAQRIVGVTSAQFAVDITLQDAVIRRFEIIGEAVKRIPEEIRAQYPNVPWKEASGFRDVLIHDYPEIVVAEVYATAYEHLPAFKVQIREVLEGLTK